MYDEVVRDSGIPQGTFSSWMRGKVRNFNAHTIERLCTYYDCGPGDLIVIVNDDESQESVGV
jgi:DNA-binding Xre family transcriptional regulator